MNCTFCHSPFMGFCLLSKLLEKACHFKSIHSAFKALVAGLEPCSVDSLFNRIGGQYAVENRNAARKRCHSNTLCHFGCYMFIMICFTADDCAKADDSIIFS